MATVTHIPNPDFVSVKTAGYTIPLDTYARVVVEVDSGGIFTINGNNAVTSEAFGAIDAYNAGGGNNTTGYTAPANARAIVNINVGAASANLHSIAGNAAAGFQASATTGEPTIVYLGPSQSIAKQSNTAAVSYTGVTIPSNATHRQAEFFLPEGTVINGSGNWRAVVEEYLG